MNAKRHARRGATRSAAQHSAAQHVQAAHARLRHSARTHTHVPCAQACRLVSSCTRIVSTRHVVAVSSPVCTYLLLRRFWVMLQPCWLMSLSLWTLVPGSSRRTPPTSLGSRRCSASSWPRGRLSSAISSSLSTSLHWDCDSGCLLLRLSSRPLGRFFFTFCDVQQTRRVRGDPSCLVSVFFAKHEGIVLSFGLEGLECSCTSQKTHSSSFLGVARSVQFGSIKYFNIR